MTSKIDLIDPTLSPDKSIQINENTTRNQLDKTSSIKRKLEIQQVPPRKLINKNDENYVADSFDVRILTNDAPDETDRSEILKELEIDCSINDDDVTITCLNIPVTIKPSVLLCSRKPPILRCSCLPKTKESEVAQFSRMAHIQQHDKWSCGFRNSQMILYNILKSIPTDHPLLRTILPQGVPSLLELQRFMEFAWREGFDPTGRKHFRGRVMGTKSKVGAMEINGIMSYLRLDCAVIQFIVCEESKSLLGPFVWEYFQRRNGCRSCTVCRTEPDSCVLLGRELLAWIEKDHDVANETCCHSVPPLYLQWEGHSVTIIGIEESVDGGYNLIVLDPMKRWETIRCDGADWWKNMCLSTKITMKKDCQIIVFSMASLTDQEREQRKLNENRNVITAAHAVVQRKVAERQVV